MAHLPDFRTLFDDRHYKLEKGLNETEDAFNKRQIVQKKGNQLINCILGGERAEGLGDFIQAVNNALAAMEKSIRFNIHSGDDSMLLLIYTELILYSRDSKNAFMVDLVSSVINNSNEIKKRLKEDRKLYKRNNYPPILYFTNSGDSIYRPEIVIDGIGTYRLESVIISSSFSRNCGLGHAVPIIRADNGKYVTLDDLTGRLGEISENTLSSILSSNQHWQSAYYVRVGD